MGVVSVALGCTATSELYFSSTLMEHEANQSEMAGVEEPESSPWLLANDDGLL